ncbi:TetR/AcrR family transcriptional regulator [Lysobacter sp. Root983]|uniref:TetR/AcrR family transcriptional regulator n=1 Tax=Lysobacter sp. Root983 TaxID=1736613 RepID=UPI00070AEAD4|nr:TetR/AcrR family transcriptional regulator [Lysobacter sp. Root983]KRD75893.1 TetR family transcriptional regulator [Lysobacter sp. Root983]
MSETAARRLRKPERREQLLETAFAIVREQGSDALTLGYLAERAGVSKPIAYEHFQTRAGLLIAMYRHLDQRQAAALERSFERLPRRLGDAARMLAEAYLRCYTTAGPEYPAIVAALKGDESMEREQQRLIDDYVARYRDALAPYSSLPASELQLRCVGIIGAGDAIAQQWQRGRIDEATAAATLASLIQRWLSAKA